MPVESRPAAGRPIRTASGSKITEKGRRTRADIRHAALSLLAESGYEGMSMRAIAERAGVSVGNAYYYFPSKAQLIRSFYEEALRGLGETAAPILADERTLEARVRGVLAVWIGLVEPYHAAAGALFRGVADPEIPGSPFGADTRDLREHGLRLYGEVVNESSTHVPEEIRLELPGILWTAHLGLTLFWVHDASFRRRRTRALVDRGPGLLTRVVSFSRLPGFGDLRRQFRDLLRDLS